MELTQYLPVTEYRTERKAGLVDVLMVLWIWAMLFMSFGPRAVQERYHYVPQILLVFLAVPVVLRNLLEGRMLRLPPEIIIYAVWVTWCLTGLFVAVSTSLAWQALGTLLKLGGMFLLMSWAVSSQRRLKTLILLGYAGGMILIFLSPALGTGDIYIPEREFAGRATGAAGNPNTLSHLAVIAFTGLLFGVATARTKPFKVVLALVMAIPIYAAFKTGSRNAWVGMFVILVLFYVFYLRTRLRGKAIIKLLLFAIISGTIVGATYLLLTYGQFAYRYKSLVEFVTTGRTEEFLKEGRVIMFLGEMEMTLDNPVFGVGAGHDLIRLPEYTRMPGFIHSDLAGLGGIFGIPGFLLFYSIPIALMVRIRRLLKHPLITPQEQKALLFCLIFLFGDLLRTVYSSIYRAKYTWTIWGGILGYVTGLQSDVAARGEAYSVMQWEEPVHVPGEESAPPSSAPIG